MATVMCCAVPCPATQLPHHTWSRRVRPANITNFPTIPRDSTTATSHKGQIQPPAFAMPSIPIHLPSRPTTPAHTENPLPQLLHTPSGLALLEIQGTIHFPAPNASSPPSTVVGKLVFPYYNPEINDPSDTKWMKRVYMYIGKGQRMTGECKKLVNPIGIMRKRERRDGGGDVDMEGVEGTMEGAAVKEELEIVELVRYRIVFSARPEPISGVSEVG